MARRLPPLNAVKAFEASARNVSFTKAAAELHVTQGAVSQQVKLLEDFLGSKLFLRQHQQLVLTEPAKAYLTDVRHALDQLSVATENLMGSGSSKVLTVSMSPDFAAKWMVHRLGDFAAAHPDIDLRVSAAMHHVDFVRENIDIAVRHGDGNWQGLYATKLSTERLFVVCNPAFARSLTSPDDIAKYPLLHLDRRDDWLVWFAAAGIPARRAKHGPILNRASLVIDAAIDGQGIALARTTLASCDLLNGRLVRPFEVSLPLRKTYWIVCPMASANGSKVSAFRTWLLAGAQSDNEKLAAQPNP